MLGKLNFNRKDYDVLQWKSGKLGSIVAIDTETTFVKRAVDAQLVTVQAHAGGNVVYYIDLKDLPSFLSYHKDSVFVMHNAPFDMHQLYKNDKAAMYDKYDRNLVKDTAMMFRLVHLGTVGDVPRRYNLQYLTERLLSVKISKDETVRHTFDQYLNLPLSSINKEHLEYAAIDAIATWEIYFKLKAQVFRLDKYKTELSHDIQAKGELALFYINNNGIRFDIGRQQEFLNEKTKELDITSKFIGNWGFVRGQKGCKTRLHNILKRLGIIDKLPKTEKSGEPSTKRKHLSPFKIYPFVKDFLHFMELEKAISFVKNIREERIYPRYVSLKNTGRTSCTGAKQGACNIQQIPRVGGLREMFIPAEGHSFIDIDYSTLELCTLAQVHMNMYGESIMGDKINEGEDLHKYFASRRHNKPIDAVTKGERQESKACYSEDTELFTRSGWASIKELYNTDIEIAQYNPHTKEISFTKPIGWVSKTVDRLNVFKSPHMDCAVSDDHRMLAISKLGLVYEMSTDTYKSNEQMSSVHGGHLNESTSHIDDLKTRLAVMIQADGSFQGSTVRLGFTKRRKIDRCKELLDKCGIDFKFKIYSNNVSTFRFKKPLDLLLTKDKQFISWDSYNHLSFIDELKYWDSNISKHHISYSSYIDRNLEVASTILILNGYKVSNGENSIRYYNNSRKKNKEYCRLSSLTKHVIAGNFKVYCPSVPTSWVLTRRNSKTVVQGNCNFGFPGGLGIDTFIQFSEGYSVKLNRSEAQVLKDEWFDTFPQEARRLKTIQEGDVYTLTGRLRAEASYCAAANTPFQGLAADGAKLALYYLVKQGFKVVAFVHDQILIEHPTELCDSGLDTAQKIMIDSMNIVTPDIKISTEGKILSRWEK